MADKYDISIDSSSGFSQQDLASAAQKLSESEIVCSWLNFPVSERDWIDHHHIETCRIAAPTFQEQARAEYLTKAFRELGHAAYLDDAGNAVVPIIFQPDLPFVAVCAHMDTVLAPRHSTDIAVTEDGTFTGPGVTDNGAGLAALLALGKLFKNHSQLSLVQAMAIKNILLFASVAEEGEGSLLGMNYLCQLSPLAKKLSSFLILDGASTGHITAEALGSSRFEILIQGYGGHSWNDFGTANPIHALARTVAILADTDLPESPRTTLSVGVMEGGFGVNSIPDLARAKVDIRSESSEEMKNLVNTLGDALKLGIEIENRRTSRHPLSYNIREIGHRPAASLSSQNYVVDVIRAVDSKLGIQARLDCASTDANIPLAMGLPAVAIGAGGRGGNVHTTSEWFHPQGREMGLQRIILALSLLLTKEFNSEDRRANRNEHATVHNSK